MSKENGRLADHLYKAPETDEEQLVQPVQEEKPSLDVVEEVSAPEEELFDDYDEEAENERKREKSRMIIRAVCAIYLLYLTYQIATDLISRYQANGWDNSYILMIVAVVAFTVFSVAVLWTTLRKQFKDKE